MSRSPISLCSRATGFTLVEMMITVAVAAALLGLGVPSMQRMFTRHAVANAADGLLGALHAARSEAMKRGGPVLICRTDPLHGACSSDTRVTWQTWIMFADIARTGAWAAGDPVLAVQPAASPRVAVTSEMHLDSVVFEPTGIVLAGRGGKREPGNVAFLFGSAASPDDRAMARRVCLNSRGASVAIDAAAVCP